MLAALLLDGNMYFGELSHNLTDLLVFLGAVDIGLLFKGSRHVENIVESIQVVTISTQGRRNNISTMNTNNGYMLSPMYDKLFDKGFITFTEKRHVILSDFISPYTWKQIGLKNKAFFNASYMIFFALQGYTRWLLISFYA